jgi:hypothetical protein
VSTGSYAAALLLLLLLCCVLRPGMKWTVLSSWQVLTPARSFCS